MSKLKKIFRLSFVSLFLVQCTFANNIFLTNPKKNWHRFFELISSQIQLDTFIESGTYLGKTSKKAALYFDHVHTIELNHDLYRKAKGYLTRYSNIKVYYGNSFEIMDRILPTLKKKNRRMLFWLDGHFMTSMNDDIAPSNDYTPIMKEIKIIGQHNLDQSVLLIDDIRLFGTHLNGIRVEHAGDAHYPALTDTCTLLQKNGYKYQLIGDILCAYKLCPLPTFSPLIEACTVSRLFNGTNYEWSEILEAERIIAEANGEELVSIEELYHDFSMPWRNWTNRSPHYNLWYGLVLQKQNRHEAANYQFQEVLRLGYNHWRIFWYWAQSLYKINKIEEAIAALNIVIRCFPSFDHAHMLLTKIKRTLHYQS